MGILVWIKGHVGPRGKDAYVMPASNQAYRDPKASYAGQFLFGFQ
jgi:hypothetical protein